MTERLVSGRYRLIEPLGAGGMGEVWQAYDERLHRTVAVKLVRTPVGPLAEEVTRQALREARIAARLQHPHAITVYDVAEDDGQPYLVMEYLPSTNLSAVLVERGTLPVEEAARVGADVAAALAAAHEAGIVHRDVKPGNILLGRDGPVKITDFGISRLVEDTTLTATGAVRGTPAYLAPEVARGERATFAADVFSLGATLYTAVEGSPPFGKDENAIALLYRVSTAEIPPPERAGAITSILTSMLAADPAARPTMAEVRDALGGDLDGLAVTEVMVPATLVEPTKRVEAVALPVDQPEPVREPRRARPVLVVAVVVLALLVAGTVFLLSRKGNEEQPGVAAPAVTTTTNAAPPPSDPPSASAEPTTEPTTTQPPVTTTTEAPAPPPPAPAPVTKEAAVSDYYALMPDGVDQGWTRLTERFQRSPAGGFAGYQRFWAGVRTVRVSEVAAAGGDSVETTVDYVFSDGRAVRERHRYALVNQGGQWKIDQVAVLSSRTG
ncbi:serine/threonine-protein kinase [Actinokineospora sp. NBRC 105648]|uniref:serine/threonine-protein kinase n=1 Tax=Actinokineospora sp. NBRC 105648 TaxID=3032206 RepID=UPI0024A0F31C|nr:serine/threonine-protein kinase [Actinokineospora sp. NBRC 105648]GLZ43795.1 hypothetical protein Acsp05_74190 [Actinokineospora sp. NBRC 105648]